MQLETDFIETSFAILMEKCILINNYRRVKIKKCDNQYKSFLTRVLLTLTIYMLSTLTVKPLFLFSYIRLEKATQH